MEYIDPFENETKYIDPFEEEVSPVVAPLPNKLKGNLGESAKQAGHEFEAAGDVVLSLPGFIAKLGVSGMLDIKNAITGSETPLQDTAKTMQEVDATRFGRLINKPLASAVFDNEKETDNTMVGEVFGALGKFIDRKAEATSEETGNPEYGEALKQGTNVAMALLGSKPVTNFVGKQLAKVKAPIKSSIESITKEQKASLPPPEEGTPLSPEHQEVVDNHTILEERLNPVQEEAYIPPEPVPGEGAPIKSPEEMVKEKEAKKFNEFEKMILDTAPGLETSREAIRNAFNEHTEIAKEIPILTDDIKKTFTEQAKSYDGELKKYEAELAKPTQLLEKLEPNLANREQLHADYEAGKGSETAFGKAYKTISDGQWMEAFSGKVINSYIENHISHLYDHGKQASNPALKLLYKLGEELEGNTNGVGKTMSTKSQFSKERTFATLAEAAEKAGLVPLTRDPIKLMQINAMSLARARLTAKLVRDAKNTVSIEGEKLMFTPKKSGQTVNGYRYINDAPQFQNVLVHESVAGAVESMFKTYKPHEYVRKIAAVNSMAKLMNFSYSVFHAYSLAEAFAGASLHNIPGTLKTTMQIGNKITDSLLGKTNNGPLRYPPILENFKSFKTGELNPDVARLIKGGLELGHTNMDVHVGAFEGMFKDIGSFVDKKLPTGKYNVASKVVTSPVQLQKFLHSMIFDYIRPALKIQTALTKEAYFKSKGMEDVAASEAAVTFANDILGGQNFTRLMLDAQTKTGRTLAEFANSKPGRSFMGLVTMAPDWLISSVRGWTQAFNPKINKTVRGEYQKYLATSLALYFVIANFLQNQQTGKNLWDYKDEHGRVTGKTLSRITLKNGQQMAVAKHLFEVPHAVAETDKFIANKMSPALKLGVNQLFNMRYYNGLDKSLPIVTKEMDEIDNPLIRTYEKTMARGKEAASLALPISVSTALNQDKESALMGASGIPIYGHTKAQLLKLKQEANKEKLRLKAYNR
jgi:hypothetical protein